MKVDRQKNIKSRILKKKVHGPYQMRTIFILIARVRHDLKKIKNRSI